QLRNDERSEVDAVFGVPGGHLYFRVQPDLPAACSVQALDEPYLLRKRAHPKADPGVYGESLGIKGPFPARPAPLVDRKLAQLGEIEIDDVEMPVGAATARETALNVGDVLEVHVVQHDQLAVAGCDHVLLEVV